MEFECDLLDDQPIVDLVNIMGGNAFVSLSQKFIVDCEERVSAIQKFSALSDFENTRIQAHTLGTSASSFGGRRLEVICRKIESDTDAGFLVADDIVLLSGLAADTIMALRDYVAAMKT